MGAKSSTAANVHDDDDEKDKQDAMLQKQKKEQDFLAIRSAAQPIVQESEMRLRPYRSTIKSKALTEYIQVVEQVQSVMKHAQELCGVYGATQVEFDQLKQDLAADFKRASMRNAIKAHTRLLVYNTCLRHDKTHAECVEMLPRLIQQSFPHDQLVVGVALVVKETTPIIFCVLPPSKLDKIVTQVAPIVSEADQCEHRSMITAHDLKKKVDAYNGNTQIRHRDLQADLDRFELKQEADQKTKDAVVEICVRNGNARDPCNAYFETILMRARISIMNRV